MKGSSVEPNQAQIVEAAKQFLFRTQLNGGEVNSFNIVMDWLNAQQHVEVPVIEKKTNWFTRWFK